MTFEQINQRIAELEKLIDPLQTEKVELKQQLLELNSKFKVGDHIEWEIGYHGKKKFGIVNEIRAWVYGDPMWIVRPRLKDLTYGKSIEVRSYMNPVKIEVVSKTAA